MTESITEKRLGKLDRLHKIFFYLLGPQDLFIYLFIINYFILICVGFLTLSDTC